MLTKLRYRWYYPKCFCWQLPRDYALYLWLFSPLWPEAWRRRKVWKREELCAVLTLGPVEFTVAYPVWSRLARRFVAQRRAG